MERELTEKTKEKRWAKRLNIDVRIRLKSIKNTKGASYSLKQEEFEVEVLNISKGGMAFRTEELLPLNSYYDAKVLLWTKETFDAVIEIVRMENDGSDETTTYGCKFIGLPPETQFKIDVYQIVSETNG